MADLVLEQCLPSARIRQIQALFDRVGQPEFARVYERAYRVREPDGLRSWIGIAGDLVALHISVSPQPFADESRRLTAGLLGDLMADETQRDFWGPVRLVRQMVGDVRRSGRIDFLLTTYLPAAETVFKAAGFKPFAFMRRHVTPLALPYLLARKLQRGLRGHAVEAVPFDDARADSLFPALTSPGPFRPVVTADYYRTRMPRQDYPAGSWLLIGQPDAPTAMVLVSPVSARELAIADIIWRSADPPLADILYTTARWAGRQSFARLSLGTLERSTLAAAARRSGFLARPDGLGLLMLSISPQAPPPVEQWNLTPFAGTAW